MPSPYGLAGYGPSGPASPITYRYPQNAGLAASVEGLRQRNIANAKRPIIPYQPSIGDQNLSGPGAYAVSGLAGRMSNYQAQQNYGATGYMPNRTVGGAYGLGGHDPLGQNRLTQQGVLSQASGNQYAPLGLGGAPSAMVGGRQMWTRPSTGAANGPSQAEYFAGRGYTQDSLGTWRPSSPSAATGGMTATMGPAGAMGGAGASAPMGLAGGTAPRSMDLRNYRLGIYNTRQQNRVAAQQAQMEAMNPQYGLAMAGLRQQGQYQQQQLGVQREGLAARERTAGADRDQRMELARLQSEQSGLQRAHEQAIASGNHTHAAGLAQAHDANNFKIAQLQSETQKGLASTSSQEARERNRVAGLTAHIQGLAGLLPALQQTDPEAAAALTQQLPGLSGQLNPGGLGGLASVPSTPPSLGASPVVGLGVPPMSPVTAQRGLTAAGNTALNQRLDALGQGLEQIPRDALPLHTYAPLHSLSSELQQLEKQGHLTAANKRQVAAALRSRMPDSVLGALGQVEDRTLGGYDPYGTDRNHATYLRNFFGMPHNPVTYEPPHGIYSHGPY